MHHHQCKCVNPFTNRNSVFYHIYRPLCSLILKTFKIMNSMYQPLIETLQTCIIDCRVCSIEMAGKESKNDCPKCCIECVDACEALLKMITSDSAYIQQYALLCAEICEYCADHCEEHTHDHCKACAKACRACAEACEKISA